MKKKGRMRMENRIKRQAFRDKERARETKREVRAKEGQVERSAERF